MGECCAQYEEAHNCGAPLGREGHQLRAWVDEADCGSGMNIWQHWLKVQIIVNGLV
jgi:hypothetical protein